MSQRGSFFDSTAGDRVYDAAAMARPFDALTTDGVIDGSGSELAVTESTPAAMSVRVGLGEAIFQGYYFQVYSAAETLTIAAANPTNPRIDRIVVRRDLSARTIALAVVQGTAAASPTAPALTQNSAGTWEFPLAQVRVEAAVASIVNAKITDERAFAESNIGTKFDTSTGHDHDGSDSKKVTYADLLSIPATFAPSAHASSHNPGGSDAVATAAPAASAVGDTQSAGSNASLARSDHKHAREAFGSPSASAVGDTSSDGASTSVAKSDHRHAREAFAAPTITLGTAAAAGAANTPIRSDATIVAFDATAPTTQAAGDAADVGAVAKAARRDHKHGMPAFAAVAAETAAFGSAAADGVAATLARSDHKHGNPAAPTPSSINAPSAYTSPATATTFRIYRGTSTPTGASEGDIWIKG